MRHVRLPRILEFEQIMLCLIISGCPAGARKWHISYFSMLLHSKKPVYLGFSGKQNCSDTYVPPSQG